MTNRTEIDKLTYRDEEIIRKILIGCTKLVSSMDNSNKKLLTKTKILDRDIAYVSTVSTALSLEGPTRPYEFREKMPESVSNISYDQMTDKLNSLKKMNLLKSVPRESTSNKRYPGNNQKERKPGRQNYYTQTENTKEVINVIEKKQARTLLFKSLSEAGIIRKYIFQGALISLIREKQNTNERINDIDLATGFAAKKKDNTSSSKDDLFEMAKKIDDIGKIRQIAMIMSATILDSLSEDSSIMRHFFTIGGTIYEN